MEEQPPPLDHIKELHKFVETFNGTLQELFNELEKIIHLFRENSFRDFFKNPDLFKFNITDLYRALGKYRINNVNDIKISAIIINFLMKNIIKLRKSTIPNTKMYGLFADNVFRKNDIICNYGGYKIFGNCVDTIELQSNYDDVARLTSYWIQADRKDITTDGYLFYTLTEPGRFANSNLNEEKNNAIFNSDETGQIFLQATRDIKRGEEIFVTYGEKYGWDNIFKLDEIKKYYTSFKIREEEYYGLFELTKDLQIKNRTKEDNVVIIKQLYKTLNKTHHGNIQLLIQIYSIFQKYDFDLRYFYKLFDQYIIKQIQDHQNALPFLSKLFETLHAGVFTEDGLIYPIKSFGFNLAIDKNNNIVADKNFEEKSTLGSIEGIRTSEDVFSTIQSPSIKLPAEYGYLFPYLCHHINLLCNFAKIVDIDANCAVRLYGENQYEIYAIRFIKKDEEIRISSGMQNRKEIAKIDLTTSFIKSLLSTTDVGFC
jgi:hypothetical protein